MLTANPVLAGCHPDPSVCRVGDEFFMVTSTFAYYPGLPIHRSTDLQDWQLIGHALIDDSWVSLDGFDVSDGIWAPTIRHHEGTFYIVFPLAQGRTGIDTLLTTASSASGPWSTPRSLGGSGIDPSLFFDDDGRCWLTAARDSEQATATGPGEIWMRELDLGTLTLVGSTHVLWHGALHGAWVEAPHIYRRGDTYHLVCAEGGTERNHAVTAASATSVTGPYATDMRSPLLTHRHLGERHPIQNVGHADLIDDADGASWALLLGVRPLDGHHTLGREVFLTPVEWGETGPVFAPGVGMLESASDDGHGDRPADWLSLRGPIEATVDGPSVILASSPTPLTGTGRPAFLARRQDAHVATFDATVDVGEIIAQDAGVVAFYDAANHVTHRVSPAVEGAVLRTIATLGGESSVLSERRVDSAVTLRIECSPTAYSFGIVVDGRFDPSASIDRRQLSTEHAGGFVGVMLGLSAEGATGWTTTFRDVEYRVGSADEVA